MRAQKGGNLKMEVQEKPTQEGSENQEVEDDMVKENYNDPGEREDDEDYFLNEDSIGSEILDWGVERAQKSEKLEMEVRETETQPEDGMLEETTKTPEKRRMMTISLKKTVKMSTVKMVTPAVAHLTKSTPPLLPQLWLLPRRRWPREKSF